VTNLSLYGLFQWLHYTAIGEALRSNRALFPLVSIFHLLGFALLVGTILVVDLALLGIGMRRQPVSRLAGQLEPWTWAGLTVMLVTGPILLTGEAIRLYCNWAFWIKLGFLVLAIAFYFSVHRRVVLQAEPARGKSVAVVSLSLWLCAGLAAKAINVFMQ
jgi:hypothetical protein